MQPADFVKGLDLGEAFYHQAVLPVLKTHYPDLKHSAALLGAGSEVLGFDTEMSTDHHWGPRLLLFLDEMHMHLSGDISSRLAHSLPLSFMGYSTNFTAPDPADAHVQLLRPIEHGPVNHRVEISTVCVFFAKYLGLALTLPQLTACDWLLMEEHRLLGITSGRVYHDGLGELTPYRHRFEYYPHDVWLYLLAAEWTKIGQEEAVVGRCGILQDDLGSRLVASRLVHSVMRLCFLMERRYPPYSKWFGTAWSKLKCAAQLAAHTSGALAALTWQQREDHLCAAYSQLARMHNALRLTPPLDEATSQFHGRPFRVIHAARFARALTNAIQDPEVKKLPEMIGSINQFVCSVDVMEDTTVRQRLGHVYSSN